MKNILKKVSIILFGCMLVMNVGCARKGSRAWVEKQISDIERVYPTENAEDLFEKFPNGFRVSQSWVFEENGELRKISLTMKGDKNTKRIVGRVSKSRIEKEPYKDIIEKESEVEYKKGENLVLAKPELTEELLPRNYFLFQKIQLNKSILGKLQVIDKGYSYETGRYDITYSYKNKEIADYLGVKDENQNIGIGGGDGIKNYVHYIEVRKDRLTLLERVIEKKENEYKEQLVGTMRNILKKASIILLGCMLVMNVGCARKGSRAWIENQISDIERVYPTENLDDLFEKFPNGFIITQTRLFDENGKRYSLFIEVEGEKESKVIKGKVSKTLLQSNPYKETVEKESEVEYKKGQNLVLANPELTEELLPRNYFLFQKIQLNKNILDKLQVVDKGYSYETGRYDITYVYRNKEIADYLGVKDENQNIGIGGGDGMKNYVHYIEVRKDRLTFLERVMEKKD